MRAWRAGKEPCFVPLLPPKETTTITSALALDYQLGYRPVAADVVVLSEVTTPSTLHLTHHGPHAWDNDDSWCLHDAGCVQDECLGANLHVSLLKADNRSSEPGGAPL